MIDRASYIGRGQSLLGRVDGVLLANLLALVITALLIAGG